MHSIRVIPAALITVLLITAVACSGGGTKSEPTATQAPVSPTQEQTPTPRPAAEPTRVQISGEDVPERDLEAAESYLQAMAAGDYSGMWHMLARYTQDLWGSQDALAAFLANKYGGRQLSFRITSAQALINWRDPEARPLYAKASAVYYEMDVDGVNAPAFSQAPLVVVPGDRGRSVVAGLGPAARRSPAVTPLPAITASIDMPILVYHHIKPELPADVDQASITVTFDEFDEQLQQLLEEGYRSITVAELANHLYYGLPIPEKPVIMTFDDGYVDALTYATHLLDAHGLVGTFGIVSGFIGSEGYLSWDQVREMYDAGMEIVSHSATHPDLGSLPPEQLAAELAGSKAAIESQVRVPVQALIYPYGEPFAHGSEDQQDRVKAALRDAGYAIGITNPLPGAYPDIHQDGAQPYELKRIMVSPNMPIERFSARLAGAELQ